MERALGRHGEEGLVGVVIQSGAVSGAAMTLGYRAVAQARLEWAYRHAIDGRPSTFDSRPDLLVDRLVFRDDFQPRRLEALLEVMQQVRDMMHARSAAASATTVHSPHTMSSAAVAAHWRRRRLTASAIVFRLGTRSWSSGRP